MIELDAISVRRNDATILDGVTLSIGAEVVALVGPSGSGKTTLLRLVLGLDAPSSGELKLENRLVSKPGRVLVPPEERNVAMVFQDLALWPHLSVRGNLAFGLEARRVPKAERERRMDEALISVGLTTREHHRPGQLSGGERQRVAIARALVLDPLALLLDEPLGSLDVALKEELVALFARVFAKLQIPTVYVAHDPREALQLAQRIVVLEHGRVVQQGSWHELAERPSTPFVAAFVRSAERPRG